MVKEAIFVGVPARVLVVGEVSNFKRHGSSGHCYFTLKDAESQIGCVMWRSSAERLKFEVADGLEIVVSGRVDVYEQRGQYQLYCDRLDPRGIGALELAFRQMRERLDGEGLFDPIHKLSIPKFPLRIAVVSSRTGDAIRDIINAIQRRFPPAKIVLWPVRVQGEGAADEIADGIRLINSDQKRLAVDVLIVSRGGGSLEDLWAFNEEVVARAIHESRIPIISGVGHELDITIADLVADLRAPTPTAAAELAVPDIEEIRLNLAAQQLRLWNGFAGRLGRLSERVESIETRPLFARPLDLVHGRVQRLDELSSRLILKVRREADRAGQRLHGAQLGLARTSPRELAARSRQRLDAIDHQLAHVHSRAALFAERKLAYLRLRFEKVAMPHRLSALREQIGHAGLALVRGVVASLRFHVERFSGVVARLEASAPRQVLRRGYTITRDIRFGRLVRSAADLRVGQRIETEFRDGRRESRIVDVDQLELFDPHVSLDDPNGGADERKNDDGQGD
jgi:exodeoxyribonuclease VII large subunit